MARGKKATIIIISIIAILFLSFFSYWAYARHRVNNFAIMEYDYLGSHGNYIKLRGTNIYYVQKGSAEKSILMVHGFGGGTFSYNYNIDELANHYTVYALDLKGFGYSQRPQDSDYSHQEQARIILEFLDRMELDQVAAAGHSMGGAAILLAYEMEPQRFERLVLISSAGLNQPRTFFSRLAIQPVVDIIYYNAAVKEDNFRRFLGSAYYQPEFLDDNLLSNYRSPLRVSNSNTALRKMISDNKPYSVRNIAQNIDIPVLIIWGKQDNWISVDYSYEFHRLIKDSQLVIVDRCGHLAMEEQYEIFNEAVLEFIQ